MRHSTQSSLWNDTSADDRKGKMDQEDVEEYVAISLIVKEEDGCMEQAR